MKIKGTNVDLGLWAEVGSLIYSLEESGVDTEEFRDEELDRQLAFIVTGFPEEEYDEIEKLMVEHTTKLLIEKYGELIKQFNEEE